jgi:hypothetical protein
LLDGDEAESGPSSDGESKSNATLVHASSWACSAFESHGNETVCGTLVSFPVTSPRLYSPAGEKEGRAGATKKKTGGR